MKKLFILTTLIVPLTVLAQQPRSLSECRQLAMENNQTVAIARENRQSATQERRAAFTRFLPRVDFVGSYTRFNKKPDFGIQEDGLKIPVIDAQTGQKQQLFGYIPSNMLPPYQKNNTVLSATITHPLFVGGKIVNQYKISRSMEAISKADESLKQAEVLYRCDELYWKVVSLQEKVKLARLYQKQIHKHVVDLENFLNEGLVTRSEVLKAKARERDAELSLLKAQNGLDLAQMALSQHVGLPMDKTIHPTDSLGSDIHSPDMGGTTQRALENRPELHMVEKTADISDAWVQINRGQYLPDIMLTAGYNWIRPSPYKSFNDEFDGDWTIGVTCQFDLFHWNERGFKLSAAKHQRRASRLRVEETRERIELDVRQAVYKVNEAVKKVRLAEISGDQAQENLQETQDLFAEGMVNSTEVLDAQMLWQQAKTKEIDAKIDYQLSRTALEKALGEL
jgi:outer membrane protein TolC